jgi:hypothetical protein
LVSIRFEHDQDYGSILVLRVDISAKRALRLWLELVRRFPGKNIIVEWSGRNDVSEDELIDYLVEIALASGHRPIALSGFSSVEAVDDARLIT